MSSLSESRRSKRKNVVSNEENKKIKASSTVWSEEDELSLLKAMIDYEVTKQANPYDDMGNFLDFVKPSLHFDLQRRQLTDKLWKLKNRFLKSQYDSSNPHHANLLDVSKSIKSWGQHATMSLDVCSDDQNVNVDYVAVDDVDIDKLVDKLSKVTENEKKGNLVSSDGRNGKKGKVVSSDSENNKKDDVVVEDVDAGKSELVGKDESKGDVVSHYHRNVEEDIVVDDVDADKSLKVDKNGKMGKIVTGGSRNGKEDNVAIDDGVGVNKVSKVVKKKMKLVTRDGQNVKEADVVLDDVNGGKYPKKGNFLISNGQNNEENDAVVGDVDAENVATHDDQNVEEDTIANAVVDDVQSPKMDGKKRVQILGDENVPREVNREDLKDFTSMFPELTNMLELETLSRMPRQIKKKCVMDAINSMGWEKANELEEEWAVVRLMKMELKAKKLDLTSKQMNLILEAKRKEAKLKEVKRKEFKP